MTFKTLAFATSVACVLATQIHSQSTDDVRKAIMGHEAFMQRCVADGWEATVAQMKEEGEIPSDGLKDEFMRVGRELCDMNYDGINVCMAGGASKAIAALSNRNARVSKLLRDPLTRADQYSAYQNIQKIYERELAALEALQAGQSSYCDVADDT